MWTVIHIAANRAQAELLKGLLESEGLMAEIRPAGISMLGDGLFEVLALESEAAEVKGGKKGKSCGKQEAVNETDKDCGHGWTQYR